MIQLEVSLPNGSVASCHILTAIVLRKPYDVVRATVQSYASVEAYTAQASYLLTDDIIIPAEGLGAPIDQAIEEALVAAGGRYAGGEILTDQSESLQAVQDRTWERIKRARAAAELADFAWDGNIFKADKEHISDGVLMAKIASDAGQPFESEFTLANDDPITLDAAQMIAVGLALGAKVEAVYARGRQKRKEIYSTTDIDKLAKITWNS